MYTGAATNAYTAARIANATTGAVIINQFMRNQMIRSDNPIDEFFVSCASIIIDAECYTKFRETNSDESIRTPTDLLSVAMPPDPERYPRATDSLCLDRCLPVPDRKFRGRSLREPDSQYRDHWLQEVDH